MRHQWHPFSVATTPKYAEDSAAAAGDQRFRFVIYVRDFGDWSAELVQRGPALLAVGESVIKF
jgi:hypothetical protein